MIPLRPFLPILLLAMAAPGCGPDPIEDDDDPQGTPTSSVAATPTQPGSGPTPTPGGPTPTPGGPTPTEAPPLTGEGPLTLSPGTIRFAGVPVGCRSDATLSITNDGDALVTVTDVVFSSGLGDGFHSESMVVALDPGAGTVIDLYYEPGAPGDRAGSAVILNDGDPATYQLPVSATAWIPEATTERFEQEAEPVDLLLLFDFSGSMAEKYGSILNHLEADLRDMLANGVDYQVGLLSAAPTDRGALLGSFGALESPFITAAMGETGITEMIALIRREASRGAGTDERNFDNLYFAISDELVVGANAGFFRPGVDLALFGMSDEDDHSLVSLKNLTERLDSRVGSATVRPAFLVAQNPNTGSCFVEKGERWIDLAEAYEGSIGEICALESYASFLDTFVSETGGIPANRIVLASAALYPDEITVSITPPGGPTATLQTGWSYSAPTHEIVFEPGAIPPAGSEILVDYVPSSVCD